MLSDKPQFVTTPAQPVSESLVIRRLSRSPPNKAGRPDAEVQRGKARATVSSSLIIFSLDQFLPFQRILSQMHECVDDNLFVCMAIYHCVRKPVQQASSGCFYKMRPGIRIRRYSSQTLPCFGGKIVSEPRVLFVVVIHCRCQFSFSTRQDANFHRFASRLKTFSDESAVIFPAS